MHLGLTENLMDTPPPHRRRYVDSITGILHTVNNYPNRDPVNYLQSIAHIHSY